MNVVLSIIIPTHNRPRILQRTLDCIAAQTLKDLEVIIVSDGPDEKTADLIAGLEWPFPINYFAIPKSQQGVCRNEALAKAGGEYVLLIGDDIFLAPDACERHVKAHEYADKKCAVLGYTTWDPSLHVTKLMYWMEKSGVQFGYRKIEQYADQFIPQEIQHWFTYTSNISLPNKIFWQHKFREDVLLYGWEDIEWGKRLAEAGIPLFYEPNAKAYHHHQFAATDVWKRSRLLGKSAVEIEKLVPDLHVVPRGAKKLGYQLTALLPTKMGRHRREFLKGMR